MVRQKRKILVCLFDPAEQQLVARRLIDLGYEIVDFQKDGQDTADLFLLDTPSASRIGQKVLARKEAEDVFLPAVIALQEDDDIDKWLTTGFDEFLRLPVTEAELKARVEIMLRMREQSQELVKKSETIYQALVESSDDHIFILDGDGVFRSSNGRVVHLGFSSGRELVGKTIEEVYSAGMAERFRERFSLAMRDGRTVVCEEAIPTPQGMRHYSGILFPVDLPSGERMVGGTYRDITDSKQAEEELRKSEERFRMIFTNSPDAISISRLEDGMFVDVNEGFAQISGYLREEIIGRTSLEIKLWADPKDRERLVEGLRKSSHVNNLETKLRRKDGSIFTALISARTIILNNVPHLLAVIRDIDELKKIQAEKEKLLAETKASYRLFESVFEHTGTATIIVNKDGTIVFANNECQNAFGFSPEEIQGTDWTDYVAPESLETMKDYFKLRFSRSELAPSRYEARIVDSKGRIRDCIVNVGVISITEQLVVSLLDITERVQAEKERRLLATAIEHAVEAVFITDRENRIIYANKGFEQVTGYSKEEVYGKTPSILKSKRHKQAFYSRLKANIYAGRPWKGRLINRKKDGSYYEALATITPIIDEKGEITHFVSVHRDVTKEREIERRIQQNQWLESIGTLAGGIAHDFNNILSPILGYAELCTGLVPPDSKIRDYLDEILHASNRARELIQQILSFSRQSVHERKPINVVPIVKETLKLLRAAIPSTIELRQEIEPVELSVMANPIEIHQVIMNLCTNAYQAMPEGGVLAVCINTVDVDKGFTRTHPNLSPGKYLKLTISDTGSGIPREIIDKIFEPYFTTKDEGQGTGLGLAVVHGIVTACGGAITVYSEPGEGTEFNLYFPALDVKPEEVSTKAPAVEGGHERVLFIDDEQAIVELGVEILEYYGYTVTSCTHPAKALELLRNDPQAFDLVITDMTMPGMTGDQLAQAILELRPDMPIILCTGFSERINAGKARLPGIKKILKKPFFPNDLARAIFEVLAKKG